MSQLIEAYFRKRGLLGWFFLLLFWTFNGLMAVWAFMVLSMIHDQYAGAAGKYSDAQDAGAAIGGAIGAAAILVVWVAGMVILGPLALITGERKTQVIRGPA